MKIVVGLGNFGDEYAYTYHNMGFLAMDCLADRLGVKIQKKTCDAVIAEAFVGGEKVIIAQPLTYMNLSGEAVSKLLSYYKCDVKDLIVVYDDIDLPRATIRVRAKGSAGTHNGMRNIVALLKTEDFARVRIGIGRPEPYIDLASYVLSTVPKADRPEMAKAIEQAVDEVEKFIGGKLFPN